MEFFKSNAIALVVMILGINVSLHGSQTNKEALMTSQIFGIVRAQAEGLTDVYNETEAPLMMRRLEKTRIVQDVKRMFSNDVEAKNILIKILVENFGMTLKSPGFNTLYKNTIVNAVNSLWEKGPTWYR